MERPAKIIQMNDYGTDADRVDENVLWSAYCRDNFEVKYTPRNIPGEKVAAVYFSSNGLWYRGKTSFDVQILQKNRFEWKRNMLKNADMHIFVRDIFCFSYYYGINNKIDSIEKLSDFLAVLTKDCTQVIMLGSSAGGYAAALVGSLLEVSYVFSFSGQFDIDKFGKNCSKYNNFPCINLPPMVDEQEAAQRDQYRQIEQFVAKSQVPIFYFVGSENWVDKDDCAIAESLANVRVFKVKNAKHGIPLDKYCVRDLVSLKLVQLELLASKCKNRVVGECELGFMIKGWWYFPWFIYHYTKLCERWLRKLIKKR